MPALVPSPHAHIATPETASFLKSCLFGAPALSKRRGLDTPRAVRTFCNRSHCCSALTRSEPHLLQLPLPPLILLSVFRLSRVLFFSACSQDQSVNDGPESTTDESGDLDLIFF